MAWHPRPFTREGEQLCAYNPWVMNKRKNHVYFSCRGKTIRYGDIQCLHEHLWPPMYLILHRHFWLSTRTKVGILWFSTNLFFECILLDPKTVQKEKCLFVSFHPEVRLYRKKMDHVKCRVLCYLSSIFGLRLYHCHDLLLTKCLLGILEHVTR